MERFIGAVGIILGLLFLSLEVYGFKVMQVIEKAYGEWWENAWRYAGESPCVFALVLTAATILFSVYLFFLGKKN